MRDRIRHGVGLVVLLGLTVGVPLHAFGQGAVHLGRAVVVPGHQKGSVIVIVPPIVIVQPRGSTGWFNATRGSGGGAGQPRSSDTGVAIEPVIIKPRGSHGWFVQTPGTSGARSRPAPVGEQP